MFRAFAFRNVVKELLQFPLSFLLIVIVFLPFLDTKRKKQADGLGPWQCCGNSLKKQNFKSSRFGEETEGTGQPQQTQGVTLAHRAIRTAASGWAMIGCCRNPHRTFLSHTSISDDAAHMMRIRFGGLATNDISKNNLLLFLPDIGVHTA